MRWLTDWVFDEAQPWEFWKPMSGPTGGAVVGALLVLAYAFGAWLGRS